MTPNTAVLPVPRLEADFYDWYARHADKVRAAASGPHDLVFIGDSITHLFEGDPGQVDRGAAVWAAYYGRRRALNLGFGWDRTQNVLWRLAHGEFAGQTPRLVVLLIGTNNLTGSANAPTNTPAEIAAGIAAIQQWLAAAAPAAHLLQLAVFPRATPTDPLRARITELNALLAAAAAQQDPARLSYLDLGHLFRAPDGSIPVTLMNDGVHPTAAGYTRWAEAIEPIVARYVGPR